MRAIILLCLIVTQPVLAWADASPDAQNPSAHKLVLSGYTQADLQADFKNSDEAQTHPLSPQAAIIEEPLPLDPNAPLSFEQLLQTDAAGNVSEVAEFEFTLSTSPSSPSLVIKPGQDDTVNASETGVDLEVSYTGMQAGHTIQLKLNGNDLGPLHIITAQEAAANLVTLTVDKAALTEGSNSLSITASDTRGMSGDSSPLTIILDTVSPNAPSVELEEDTGSSATDNISNNGDVKVSGIESDATWEYRLNNGTSWISGNHPLNGIASIPASVFSADGVQHIEVRQTDAAGNISSVTNFSFTLDTTQPATPSLALAQDTGSSHTDKITNNGNINVTGLESGASWEYSLDGGAHWTAGSGNSIAASVFGSDGEKHVRVRQTDLAGNQGDSTAESFILDTTAPATITLTTKSGQNELVNASESGVDIEISYIGLEEGDEIQLKNGGHNIGTVHTVTTADVIHGKATIHLAKSSLIEGNNSITATVTDQAGNIGLGTAA